MSGAAERGKVIRMRRVLAMLTCAAMTLLLWSSTASASYEQVSTFGGTLTLPTPPGNFPEKAQLGGASGMAINVAGVGGVSPGTVYVADAREIEGGPAQVAVFDKEGNFRMAWTGSARCGAPESLPPCDSHPASGRGVMDVEVDQATGNVYVFNGVNRKVGEKLVSVYNATGTELISEFGELAAEGETTAATPDKIHFTVAGGLPGAIAVDKTGTVYIFDMNFSDSFRYRLMVFRPQAPGDYEHYVYAGESSDVDPGTIASGQEAKVPSRPVTDYAGNIYVAGENYIQMLDPEQPTAPPLCTFNVKDAGVRGMGVNPETREVFFYNYKDRRIHQLSACTAGAFTEIASFSPSPKRDYIEALAVNPALRWEPVRSPGVLYGVAPGGTNEGGGGEPGQSSLGYIYAEGEEAAIHEPIVESESVSQIGIRSATLKAQINPNGVATEFLFQYITDVAYQANDPSERFAGASETPLGGGSAGGGIESALVSSAVSGLSPDTTYQYRVVATNSEGTATGTAEEFHTYPLETSMPDNRGYELVSPIDKHGGEVFPVFATGTPCFGECKPTGFSSFPRQSSANGNALVYQGSNLLGDGALENEFLSRRTASGWETVGLSPRLQGTGNTQGFKAIDPDLTKGLIYQVNPTLSPEAPSGYANLYRQSATVTSALEPLLIDAPPNRPPGLSFSLQYAGASTDFSRIFFMANDALTEASPVAPAAEDGGQGKFNLYEWHQGLLKLVNVLPGNATAPVGASFGRPAGACSGCPLANLAGAISTDGSRVFWTSPAGQVYLREDGSATKAVPGAGNFVVASVDGSKVLLDSGKLYDLEGESEVDLTNGQGGYQGVLDQTDDLTSIYFVDTAVLDTSPNSEGEIAQSGQDNLYLWQEGSFTYIATLGASDQASNGGPGAWAISPSERKAQASPNGRWLSFQSTASLTGYDNVGPCRVEIDEKQGPIVKNVPCPEVYLYDAARRLLLCPSCKVTGESPLGPSELTLMASPDPAIPPVRRLTDSGRLYFDSDDRLSPLDTNGSYPLDVDGGVEDVYQYEPEGVGSCGRETGCVTLISGGREQVDSNFLGTDLSGNNAFFTTRDQLIPADKDSLVDLYDARVGGGFPVVASPGECLGEGCQAASPIAAEPLPASLTASGLEAPKKQGCTKGKVKRKGRCVKKHHHRRKSGNRAHSKSKGSK